MFSSSYLHAKMYRAFSIIRWPSDSSDVLVSNHYTMYKGIENFLEREAQAV